MRINPVGLRQVKFGSVQSIYISSSFRSRSKVVFDYWFFKLKWISKCLPVHTFLCAFRQRVRGRSNSISEGNNVHLAQRTMRRRYGKVTHLHALQELLWVGLCLVPLPSLEYSRKRLLFWWIKRDWSQDSSFLSLSLSLYIYIYLSLSLSLVYFFRRATVENTGHTSIPSATVVVCVLQLFTFWAYCRILERST